MTRSQAAILCLVLIAGLVVAFEGGRRAYRQHFGFQRDWCEQQVRAAAPILTLLEEHRARTGEYPESLAALDQPERIPLVLAHPSFAQTDRGWTYERIGARYELACRPIHGIPGSTWDWFVHRPGGEYPESWSEVAEVFEVGEWRYVIGGQDIYRHELRKPPATWEPPGEASEENAPSTSGPAPQR